MLILGVHGGHKRVDEDNRVGYELHDSAAALIDDGEILAAIEEERLNRVKHSNHFPVQAIKYCLNQHKLGLQDVDLIAANFEESVFDFWAKRGFLEDPTTTIRPEGRKFLSSLFEREFGVIVEDKIRFCKHHLAHAWSAYAVSGLSQSLVLVLDGEGDNRSGMVLVGEGSKITQLCEYDLGQSLGDLYTQIIKLLGYHRFDEYKVMGLAPYGNPKTYSSLFERCYKLLPGGNYTLEDPVTWLGCFDEAGLLTQARRKGAPFTQVHKDLAAALQATLERIVFHILEHYKKVTNQKNLCLAGGVAHNCTMNGKILYSGLFESVFVQPAAHDAGGALGAALSVLNEERPGGKPRKLTRLDLGTDIGNDGAIGRILSRWHEFIEYERVDDVAEKAAHLMANGSVIGWAQGRSEFGPRALGNRSILADPRPAGNKLLINQMVKKRESYRPFAPTVLEEKLHEFFEVPPSRADYSFMIYVLKVRDEMRERLGAITHVDGTARVQTVSRQTNLKYWELISAFEKLTGIPILLNTSFNNNVEPIVNSAEEAVTCFLTTGINYLVLGNYLVAKRDLDPSHQAYRSLIPSLPPSRRLVKRTNLARGDQVETVFEVESGVSHFFSNPLIQVSEDTFTLLQGIDGKKSIDNLLGDASFEDDGKINRAIEEIILLWSQRALALQPPKPRLGKARLGQGPA